MHLPSSAPVLGKDRAKNTACDEGRRPPARKENKEGEQDLTKVARIDPNFIEALGDLVGNSRRKVDVGNERNLIAANNEWTHF